MIAATKMTVVGYMPEHYNDSCDKDDHSEK